MSYQYHKAQWERVIGRTAAVMMLRADGWTYDQIAELMGLSRERIRQILYVGCHRGERYLGLDSNRNDMKQWFK